MERHEEIRDFLLKIRAVMPDDLFLEIMRFYGLRDVLAFAMNLESKTIKPERVRGLIETHMGIEYTRTPDVYDKLALNRDEQRVYGLKVDTSDFGAIDLKLEPIFSKSKSYEMGYPDESYQISESFTNESFYFGIAENLVKMDPKDPTEEAEEIPFKMSYYVVKYLMDEKKRLHGILLDYVVSHKVPTILGIVSFFEDKRAFDFNLYLELHSLKNLKLYPLAIHGDKVFIKGISQVEPFEHRLLVYDSDTDFIETIVIDPTFKIIAAEVNFDSEYLLIIGTDSPGKIAYDYRRIGDLVTFSRQELTLNPQAFDIIRPDFLGENVQVISDHSGDFFWRGDPEVKERDFIVRQRLILKTELGGKPKSDLLKEFTQMSVKNKRAVCKSLFQESTLNCNKFSL